MKLLDRVFGPVGEEPHRPHCYYSHATGQVHEWEAAAEFGAWCQCKERRLQPTNFDLLEAIRALKEGQK